MKRLNGCFHGVATVAETFRICPRHMTQLLALCLAFAAVLPAQVVRFRYSGVVTNVVVQGDLPQGSLPAGVVVGAPIAGSFVVDKSSPDYSSTPGISAYGGLGVSAAVGGGACILSSGAFERIWVNVANDYLSSGDFFNIFTQGPRGAARCGAFQTETMGQAGIRLTLIDSTGTAFASTQLPTTLNIGAFESSTVVMGAKLNQTGPGFIVEATITTIETAEPAGGGTSQNDAVLPDIRWPGDFIFMNAARGIWFDPPLAFGYNYSMLSSSLFTGIVGFPSGFSSPFTVSVDGAVVGTFGPGDSADFTGFPGGGVPSFTLTGISPAVDAADPSAFPLQLMFNTPQADFRMQAITAGEVYVTIDIKPDSEDNTINLGSNGVIPVAILSEAGFDATTVDPTTVSLSGATVKLKGKGTPMYSLIDVNGDGLLDLEVMVSTEVLELSDGDTMATLAAETFDGVPVIGSDTVRIVP